VLYCYSVFIIIFTCKFLFLDRKEFWSHKTFVLPLKKNY